MAWPTTDGSTAPERASCWSTRTTVDGPSILKWRRAAARVSEKPKPSAPRVAYVPGIQARTWSATRWS